MKKSVIFLCLFFTVLGLYAKAVQEDYKKGEDKARLGYALGMIIGTNLGFGQMDIEFDYDAFTEGLKAIVKKEPTQFSEQEAIELIEAALYTAEEKQNSQNKQIEDEYLATNATKEGIKTTESGLQYEIIRDTDGEKPTKDSTVRVKYTGIFTDGRLFDNSPEENGAYIPLANVIPGWTEGLMLMSVGSIYRLYIPSKLAYGSDGIQGVIPPYTTLIFNVELLEITETSEQEQDQD